MDDLSEKINGLLNDEESMRQIRELADMLTGGMTSEGTNTDANAENNGTESFDPDYSAESFSHEAPKQDKGGIDLSSLLGMLGGAGGGGGGGEKSPDSGGIDMGTAMQLMSVIGSTGENDKNRTLLLALRPLVGADKQAKIDKAVKLLRLYAVFNALRKSGFTDKLL